MSQRSVLTIKFNNLEVTLVRNSRDLAASQNVALGKKVLMVNETAVKALNSIVGLFSGWRGDMLAEVIAESSEIINKFPKFVSWVDVEDQHEPEVVLEISISRETRFSTELENEHNTEQV